MKVIGITGGVGSGKSLVLEYLRNLSKLEMNNKVKQIGTYVVEADKVAHILQKKGNLCYDAIVSAFGDTILEEDGAINRKKLGDIVFSDEKQLEELNRIVHPFVKKYIIQKIDEVRTNQTIDYFFIEAALLIEEHYDAICDELWYIYVKRELRKERLERSRGYTEEKSEQIMSKQLDETVFREACGVIIDNNGTAEATYQQIREVLVCQNS